MIKLAGIDLVKAQLARAGHVDQLVHHLDLDALDDVHRDVKEVARAARGIEEAELSQPLVKLAQPLLGELLVLRAPALADLENLGLHGGPSLADRLLDGGANDARDELGRGVFGAQAVALLRIEGACQQRAKDGRLDVGPVRLRGLQEHREIFGGEGQRFGVLEKVPVEAEQLARPKALPVIHRAP